MALSGEGMDHEDNREDPSVLPSGSCAHSCHDTVFPGEDELSDALLSLYPAGMNQASAASCA
jgi:hypothetical protein